jgi:hypothetical protein
MSCTSTRTAISPLPEMPPFESAIYKIKQNAPEIEKYFLFNETGELIVKAELTEKQRDTGKTENFQVLYHLKKLRKESAGCYVVPFTVLHLETGAIHEDILLWKPQKDGTGILLSFDDDYFDTWERYFNLFDRYNAHVTFFVLGTYTSFSDKAMKRGHDVGYHSLSHSNLKFSRQTFYAETISPAKNFRNAGVPLVSFAYPFGFYESWMNEELLKTYRILRGFNTSFQVYGKTDIVQNGFIFSKSVDNVLFRQDEYFMAEIGMMLRALKFTGRGLILPLTSHNISDTDDWGIKPHRLEYILQTARDLQLNFYRYRDILP